MGGDAPTTPESYPDIDEFRDTRLNQMGYLRR